MSCVINRTKTVIIALVLLLAMFSISYARSNSSLVNVNYSHKLVTVKEDYSFKVYNNTKLTITKVLVSEDGKNYGYFDIGNGIGPGETGELTWDTSTNGESCHQYFKAEFANGEQSQAVKFDFCESGLVLEFD